ncbi:hypothetical protein CBL_09658 [Carabus blaptoides fortunei]
MANNIFDYNANGRTGVAQEGEEEVEEGADGENTSDTLCECDVSTWIVYSVATGASAMDFNLHRHVPEYILMDADGNIFQASEQKSVPTRFKEHVCSIRADDIRQESRQIDKPVVLFDQDPNRSIDTPCRCINNSHNGAHNTQPKMTELASKHLFTMYNCEPPY